MIEPMSWQRNTQAFRLLLNPPHPPVLSAIKLILQYCGSTNIPEFPFLGKHNAHIHAVRRQGDDDQMRCSRRGPVTLCVRSLFPTTALASLI